MKENYVKMDANKMDAVMSLTGNRAEDQVKSVDIFTASYNWWSNWIAIIF